MAHELPRGARLSIDDGQGRFVPVPSIVGMCMCGYCQYLRGELIPPRVAAQLEQHNRFDVGHELVLPERARSDHR